MQDEQGSKYPLHKAVLRADACEASRPLEAGADPNTFDLLGMTPLAWAVYGGYTEIVELLCRSGAAVDLRTRDGATALWHAEDDFGLYEIAAVLRAYGASEK